MSTVGRFCLYAAFISLWMVSGAFSVEPTSQPAATAFRPPSVPLVAHDPYFSIWSPSDKLTDTWPVHWTGTTQALQSMIRVDGQTYRLMGLWQETVPVMPQVGLTVLPTRTIYQFANDQVHVTLTFTTPALPNELEILARPVTYLQWDVRAVDGKTHTVAFYYDNTAELVVNTPEQEVLWSREPMENLVMLRIGTKEQPVLAKKGDNLRIDWGYLYAAAVQANGARGYLGGVKGMRRAFVANQPLPATDDTDMPRAVENRWPGLIFTFDLGTVGNRNASCWMMLAYDDLYSILYMDQKLRPYWRRKGWEAADLLQAAARDYPSIRERCEQFDRSLMVDLERAGGRQYAQLCALSYRQCLAGNKIAADSQGRPLVFPKENFSNGCIATVDVIYPMAPFFLLFNPELSRGMLIPVLDYAASPRWKFPFAPHDLGTYPHATGQVYGGGEKTEENQMPVEETGNLLLLLAAQARIEGNADFAAQYAPQLTRWAEYLKDKGMDPENQLCTDDFAGHLAHNVNLSVKAILGIAAYAQLCDMQGKQAEAAEYRQTAKMMAAKWVEMANDGDHFRLAFDKPNTWSQKYNLVWDKLLKFNLFPPEVVRKEIAFYKSKLKPYGLPLDNRSDYTKSDWEVWTATLADSPEDFQLFIAPMYRFLNETPDRVPFTDWYWTHDAKMKIFQARPVIGGVFIKMMEDENTWKKWANQLWKIK